MGYVATLQRGDSYILGKKKFEHGVPKEITEKEKGFLEKAVDKHTHEGEEFTTPKFKIAEAESGGDKDPEAGGGEGSKEADKKKTNGRNRS